jgi:hypothetical protein
MTETLTTTEAGVVVDAPWSAFTGKEEPVGTEDGRQMVAREREDGLWSWYGFAWASLEQVQAYAKEAGF